jgi:DNA-binding beta-propeller fold protein YncE
LDGTDEENLMPLPRSIRFLVLAGALASPLACVRAAAIRTVAGNGTKGFSGDGAVATAAQLSDPGGIARGPDGALYICDTANHRIRKVTPDGRITTVAGTGEAGWSGDGGPAIAAKLHEPYEVRFDRAGNIYWVERASYSVRRLDPKTGIIATIAGSGTAGFSGDGGPATSAQFNDPHSIGFDRAGDLYICDVKNNRIRKVAMKTGVITTLAGTGKAAPTPDGAPFAGAALAGPRALDFDRDGNLWVALREGNMVLKLDLGDGTVHRLAGNGQKGFTGDGGPANTATLNGPKGISVGPDGKVFIADTENHVIRVIDSKQGTIALVAGTGKPGDGPEGDPLACALKRPHGIFVDADGAIYIGDTETYRVRVISAGR